MSVDIAIRVNNLSKKYTLQHVVKDEIGNDTHQLWALKNVSFEIKKGESVGIIGPNGSGKSTVLKILAGVTKPTSGRVEIHGKVASILDIGAGFHPELTGRENVFLNAQILGFSRKEILSNFSEIVEFSGIEKYIDEPVKNYSNGMYLRLAFSIMVHLDFDVYLFDEVLSVGDIGFRKHADEKLNVILHSNKTVVFATHNVSEFYQADYFLVLEKGNIQKKINTQNFISNYVASAMDLNNIVTTNFEMKNFPDDEESDEVKITNVSFKQESDYFRTDMPFLFEIEYLKLKNINTIDVVLIISTIEGSNIICSTPFVRNNFSNKTDQGNYKMSCCIPSCIFNAQVYALGIVILKNSENVLKQEMVNQTMEQLYNKSKEENVISKKILFYFKLAYFKYNTPSDLSKLNMNGQLLAGFQWNE